MASYRPVEGRRIAIGKNQSVLRAAEHAENWLVRVFEEPKLFRPSTVKKKAREAERAK